MQVGVEWEEEQLSSQRMVAPQRWLGSGSGRRLRRWHWLAATGRCGPGMINAGPEALEGNVIVKGQDADSYSVESCIRGIYRSSSGSIMYIHKTPQRRPPSS